MAKKIYFSRYDNTDAVYNPGPASKFIPEWYKDAKSYLNDEKKPNIEKELKKTTVIRPETEQILIKQVKSLSQETPSASPKARKFARELGVDITQVMGSEKDGRVIEDDIKKFVLSNPKNINEIKDDKTNKIKNEFEHSDFGEIEIKDIPRVKKLSSTYLTNSWTTIPHVTNHDEADITEMESFRSSLTDIYTGEKIKNLPNLFLIVCYFLIYCTFHCVVVLHLHTCV